MKIVLKERLKTHKGITLIALVITIIVLLILAGVAIATLTGDNGIIAKAQQAKMQNDKAAAKEKVDLAIAASFDETGKIDLGQLKNNLNNIDGINPKVGDLTDESFPLEVTVDEIKVIIKKDGNGNYSTSFGDDENLAQAPTSWVKTTKTDSNWYSYNGDTVNAPKLVGKMTPIKYNLDLPSGANKTNKWANAITADGSMWVWIPRYAYQISTLYHQSSETGGKINIKFMKGTTDEAADGTTTWQNSSGQGNWNIHPGFEYSSTAPGLWVAKFEASQSDAGANTADYQSYTGGTSGVIKIQPGVNSWRNISVFDVYTKCLNYETSLNSHMMKNSEWGAVVYLAQSSYGKNAEVWINPNSNYLTGHAGTGKNVEVTLSTSEYNTTNGVQASTTGNVYGIYDMSGGAFEQVAAYVNNGSSYITDIGGQLATGESYTKDVYDGMADQFSDYERSISHYGDAVYEISERMENTGGIKSWFGFPISYPVVSAPFIVRGDVVYSKFTNGMFFFTASMGASQKDMGLSGADAYGFRPVLISL